MNVALIGSVSSSWTVLDALIRSGVSITGVLGVNESRADAIGDYRSLRRLAGDAELPYHSFNRVSEPGVREFLLAHKPDLLWVIGLSQPVDASLISLADGGGVGFHPTPLPIGRGRAPVAWTILLDAPAAATLIYLTDKPDAGDIIAQRPVPVLPEDYSEDLIARTNTVLAEMVADLAPAIKTGQLPRRPQDHSRATFYEERTPADGLIDWTRTTDQVYRLIRAAGRPYPGAFTIVDGKKVIIWRAKPAKDVVESDLPPGAIVRRSDGVFISTRDGMIRLTEVQCGQDGDMSKVLASGMQAGW